MMPGRGFFFPGAGIEPPCPVLNLSEHGHTNPARIHDQGAATMKLPVRTLLYCILISLAACESSDTPDRKPATPAATVEPAGGNTDSAPLATDTIDNHRKEATADDLARPKVIKELSAYDQQQAYLQELQNPSPEIRAAAAKKIKPVGDALNQLTDMLVNDSSPEVRIATTWSLEMTEDAQLPQVLDALVKRLQDKDLNVVVECIQSLKFLGDQTTIVHLQPYLTHQDAEVRNAAFEAVRFLQ